MTAGVEVSVGVGDSWGDDVGVGGSVSKGVAVSVGGGGVKVPHRVMPSLEAPGLGQEILPPGAAQL